MNEDGEDERKRNQITMETTRWREDINVMRATLASLDTELDWYERSIKAVKEERAGAGFVAGIRQCIAEIEQGERYKKGAEEAIERAKSEMSEWCKRQARSTDE